MNNATIAIKITKTLNKLASQDFENLPCWSIVDSFNKGQRLWCRRNLHGDNIVKEGDEQSTSRIDDLQKLIVTTPPLTFTDKGIYFESDIANWPKDYLRFKRISLDAFHDCCNEPARMIVDLAEEGNVDVLLNDVNRRPSYAWRQTFAVIKGNSLNIYHNNEFTISEAKLIHYRQPINIQITGCKDPYTGLIPTVDVECEFKEDLIELLVDEAASILAGDIESLFQKSRLENEAEKNN